MRLGWALLLAACGGAGANRDGGGGGSDEPAYRTLAEIEPHFGRPIRVIGRYDVAPVALGKRLQPVEIVLDDGTRFIRAYRPVAAELRLLERRVVVDGRFYPDAHQPPDVEQVMAPHVEPERIELAPGEKPAPAAGGLPAPPLVEDAAGLRARDDRWAMVHGRLDSVTPRPGDDLWADAVLELADGAVVDVPGVSLATWERLSGAEITVVGRPRWAGAGARHRLDAESGMCEGRVPRCHMQ